MNVRCVLHSLSDTVFSMLVMALVACLKVLLRLSQAYMGFTLSNIPRIILAYTLVSVVIFVGWIWQVLDLEVKKMQPWIALSAGPVATEDSLLLDYVGAGPLALIQQALQSRRWRVLLATLGLWIANAGTVAAYSLWVVEVASRSNTIAMVQTSLFDGLNAHASTYNVGFVHTYLGNVTFGLPLPSWISDDYVLASFNASRPTKNTLLRAKTDGHTADLIRKIRLTYRASVHLRRSSEVRVALVGKSQLPDADLRTARCRIGGICFHP
jgi:hypothetical protein